MDGHPNQQSKNSDGRDLRSTEYEQLTALESRELLEFFTTITPPLFWIADSAGNYTFQSRGWSKLIGRSDDFEQRIHPDDSVRREEIRAHAFGVGTPYQLQYRIQTEGGSYRWLLERALARHGPDGRLAGMIATCLDVTDEHDEHGEAWRRERLEDLGRLAGGAAHDFNNLLTVIIGYAHVLRDELPEDGEQRECVSEVLAAAELGRSMTLELLAFGGRQILKPVTLDLNETLESLKPILRQALGESIDLVMKLGPPARLISVDDGQLGRVLLNLVHNSKDAMPHGGTLTISTSTECSQIVLRVSDTGSGMDELTKERLFEPFFTTKAHGRGTGLGLATVYGIVTQHQGRLQVESTLGKGTTMIITLPPAEQTFRDPPAPERVQPALAGTRVLVVDDDPWVLSAVRRLLTKAGCMVYEANQPKAAQETFAAHFNEIDLVLTDVVMPTMNGPELVQSLRSVCSKLPVLYMSGCIEVRLRESLDGVVLTKPFTPAELVEAVTRVLTPRKALAVARTAYGRSVA